MDSIAAFLADLDTGPETCLFLELCDMLDHKASVAGCLGFVQPLEPQARAVTELLLEYKRLVDRQGRAVQPQLITQSVAMWIFHTNKIEYAGTATLRDTEAWIRGVKKKKKNSTAEKEVLQTLQLLKETYSAGGSLKLRLEGGEEKLQRFHKTLFADLLPDPGCMRMSGVRTENTDGSENLYHHTLVSYQLKRLMETATRLGKMIDNTYNEDSLDKLVLYTFALAGFTQFHFVDLHPFSDGNGRMSRFLSKLILDRILPLPIPMFENRDAYLEALIKARDDAKQDVRACPLRLTRLLLDSTFTHYKSIIDKYLQRPFSKLLVAAVPDEFERLLSAEDVDNSDWELLRVAWEGLEPKKHADVRGAKGVVYRIKRIVDWDLDGV